MSNLTQAAEGFLVDDPAIFAEMEKIGQLRE
jgi:hypothetical protein